MKRNALILVIALSTVLFISCKGNKTAQAQNDNTEVDSTFIGDQSEDPSLRICAEGLVWSDIKQDCVNLTKDALGLKSVEGQPESTLYVIFNSDSAQAEVFYPESKGQYLLDRRNQKNIWNEEDDDTPNLTLKNGVFTLDRRGVVQYQSAK